MIIGSVIIERNVVKIVGNMSILKEMEITLTFISAHPHNIRSIRRQLRFSWGCNAFIHGNDKTIINLHLDKEVNGSELN